MMSSMSTETSKIMRRDEPTPVTTGFFSGSALGVGGRSQGGGQPTVAVTYVQPSGTRLTWSSFTLSSSSVQTSKTSSNTPKTPSSRPSSKIVMVPTVFASSASSTFKTTGKSSESQRIASTEAVGLFEIYRTASERKALEERAARTTASPMGKPSSELLPRCERVLAFVNSSHDPCDNFYQYACGKFKGKSKLELLNTYDLDQHEVKEITMSALSNGSTRSEARPLKYIRRFFQKCIDEEIVSKDDWKPIVPLTMKVSISSSNTREKAISAAIVYQVPTVIAFSIEADPSDSEKQVVVLNHPSSMIDMKDLRANESDDSAVERRSALKKFLEIFIRASLQDEPKKDIDGDVEAIWSLEIALANISDQGDPRLNVKRTTVDKLQDEFKGLNLTTIVNHVLDGALITEVMIKDVKYLKQLAEVLDKHNNTLRRYSEWKAVASYGWAISPFIADAMFDYSRAKTGSATKPTRREKCLDTLFSNAPFVIGRAYIDAANFTQLDKKRAEEFVSRMQESILTIIQEQKWMDEETKKRASAKIKKIKAEVGYPEWIREDKSLTESFPLVPPANDSLIEYLVQLKTHRFKERINQSNRQGEWARDWLFSPAWPMGGYHLVKNRMLLPAANLFDPDRCHFGGVPADVGAEITYAVDRNGAVFDEKRGRKNWWTESTAKQFASLTESILKRYPGIVEPSTADFKDTYAAYLGGIRILYGAVFESKRRWKFDPLPNTTVEPAKMFFLSYAYLWCANPDSEEKGRPNSRWNSKWEYRTNVPLKNFEKFAEAFSCPKGSPMNPSYKVRVW